MKVESKEDYQKAINEKLNNKRYLKYENRYRKAFEEIKDDACETQAGTV